MEEEEPVGWVSDAAASDVGELLFGLYRIPIILRALRFKQAVQGRRGVSSGGRSPSDQSKGSVSDSSNPTEHDPFSSFPEPEEDGLTERDIIPNPFLYSYSNSLDCFYYFHSGRPSR